MQPEPTAEPMSQVTPVSSLTDARERGGEAAPTTHPQS
jgi:hypothetical protein